MKTGEKNEFTYRTLHTDSAKSIVINELDDFPDVLATSRMVAIMEVAASRLMKGELQSDQLSVGVNIDVDHLAATPIGSLVTVRADFIGMKGKLYHFNIEMHDDGGLAGKGTHTRAIISTKRLIEGAEKRVQKS